MYPDGRMRAYDAQSSRLYPHHHVNHVWWCSLWSQAHAWEAEAGVSQVQGYPRLHGAQARPSKVVHETLSLNKKKAILANMCFITRMDTTGL